MNVPFKNHYCCFILRQNNGTEILKISQCKLLSVEMAQTLARQNERYSLFA